MPGTNNREIKGCGGVNRPRQFQPDNVIGQPHKMRQVENMRSNCQRESKCRSHPRPPHLRTTQ
ncbi:MAG: hypothetical protein RLZZ536_1707, partial [Planctomycetota bacterium]